MRIGPLSPAILKHLRKTKQNQRKKKADEMTWHMSAQNMREQQVLVWLHSGPVADVPRVSPTGVLTPFWLTRSAGRMASEGGSVKNSAECRQAKDVIKAVKKRMGHKSPRVQLLALTADMYVRDKILVLLDSWQEAFGGPRGKYPQYFWAYDELRRTGVEFPDRVEQSVPIFTPPPTHSRTELSQPGYGMPSHIASRLDEAMASDVPQLSLSEIESARGGMEVLAEMLHAVDPKDKNAVKDEVIVDLVEQCRSSQRRVLQLVNTTSDEELLRQGLVLNDDLQNVLAKHDAIASGSPLPQEPITFSSNAPSASAPYEEDEAEDDFTKLARRPSRLQAIDHQDTSSQNSLTGQLALPAPEDVAEDSSKRDDQLDLPEPPQPIKTSNVSNHEQQLIDLFSGDLTGDMSPQGPVTPPPVTPSNGHPVSPLAPQQDIPGSSYASNGFQQQQVYPNGSTFQQQPYYSQGSMPSTPQFSSQQGYQNLQQYSPYLGPQYQNYSWNPGHFVQNSYVVPWASGFKQEQSPNANVGTYGSRLYNAPSQVSPVSSSYPPPPWTSSSLESVPQSISPQQRAMLYGNNTVPASSSPSNVVLPLQQQRSFSSPSERPALAGEQQRDLIGNMQNMSLRGNMARQASSITIQPPPKPYTTPDRLFGDLIDLRSASTNIKTSRLSQNLSKESSS
ncbi:TOM1-like protein 6 isoform X2 [Cryptomeria japonica]|uniref:TOM1-like protein 6 isoform X2 n=1 Tax=Cryptomeria japonica TaxID=3369 RepID=UPI0027DA8778|nr:TOM1-like protein 6 isoform X2 [Cryptomeria japonica]